ncbi:MAG: U32 family peptidase [Spirochaetaceae bacterium]|jgi:putative protease|nr:U32 family peptidase [Spirochaetaceae bacterium]
MLELLAPAGSPEALDAAVGAGADAIYLGLKSFNARMRSVNFAYAQFEGALRSLHRMKRKVYVTVNTVFEQREADRMYQLLKYLALTGPDGLIVQDFGIIPLVREHFPSLKLHASTQMNIASARGVNLLSKHGISRTVLARELTLEEIREIRLNTNAELEAFVHGALCVSASGLCLFSSYLGGKSANRGMCTQACRRLYRRETQEEGYFFSPSDLQLLERLPALADAGVNACKIEGRMKSAEYVGTVVSAYRLVIDALGGTRTDEAVEKAQKILLNDFARGKTVFYIEDKPPGAASWLKSDQSGGTGISLGVILEAKGSGAQRRGRISARGTLPVPGDSIRLHRADDTNRQAHKLAAVEAEGDDLWLSIPEGFDKGDEVYLIQTKAMTKRYAPVIPRRLDSFKRAPGRESAPVFSLPAAKRTDAKTFPAGIYLGVSRVEDLYMIQSAKAAGAMLGYTRKTAVHLMRGGTLPFAPEKVILTLDPYFPQSMDRVYAEEIPQLLSRGYRRFAVNNPGHFSYFRNTEASLIAGPYLYVFNRWANSFIADLGTDYFISPLENNRQNLERTVEPKRRIFTFITVFAYPPLFRIRADLGETYPFCRFSDSRGEEFFLISQREGSQVIPEKPFSIIDKIPFLQEAGYGRFIVDISGLPMKKRDYRDILRSVENAVPLANTSRFNWKDGFYQETKPV